MMTESFPVQKGSPNMMRLQNSTVTQANGKTQATKTQKLIFWNVVIGARMLALLAAVEDTTVSEMNISRSKVLMLKAGLTYVWMMNK